jgi:hypothetical protein
VPTYNEGLRHSPFANSHRLDKKDYFTYPVTEDIAPDYRDIIQHPMAFSDIIEKLNSHTYTSVEEFEVSIPYLKLFVTTS